MIYLFAYLLVINLVGFLSMWIDKRRAKQHKWRIPEKRLFFIALVGGSLGSNLGMHLFRHKTKHWYFRFGMPLIFLLQVGAAACFLCSDKVPFF